MTRPKKNSQKIWYNPRTKKTMIVQSDTYMQFERDCAYFMPKLKEPIDRPVNLKCTFYVPDKRKRDLGNMCYIVDKFFCDALVKSELIEEDNYFIIDDIRFHFSGLDNSLRDNYEIEVTIYDRTDTGQ